MSGAVSRCTPTTPPPPSLPALCKPVQTTERAILGKASQTTRKAFQSLFQSTAYKGLDDYRKLYLLKQVKSLKDPANIKGVKTLLQTTPLMTLNERQLGLVVANLKGARNKPAVVKAYQQILTDPPFKHAAMRTQLALLAKPLNGAKLTMNALVPKALHLPDKNTFGKWIKAWVKQKAKDSVVRPHVWKRKAEKDFAPTYRYFMRNWYKPAYGNNSKTNGQVYKDASDGKYDKPGSNSGYNNWKHLMKALPDILGRIARNRMIHGIDTPYPF